MSTELAILLSMFVFVLFGVFRGEGGLKSSFENSAPKLGARLERNLETGGGFHHLTKTQWVAPRK